MANKLRAGVVLPTLAGVLWHTAALAVPVPVINPGFEADVVPGPTNIDSGVPAGWSAYFDGPLGGAFFGSLYAAPDNYPAGAPEGNNVAVNFISASQASGVGFGITQVLGAVIEPDTRYTLTVEVGNIDSGFNDLNNTPANPGDDPFFDIRGYNGYRIELRASDGGAGALLVADDNSRPMADGTFETRRIFIDSDTIDPALIGRPLEVRLVNLNLVDPLFPDSDRETNFDNVRVTATPVPPHRVPVPGWALASLTVLILIRAPRARRPCR